MPRSACFTTPKARFKPLTGSQIPALSLQKLAHRKKIRFFFSGFCTKIKRARGKSLRFNRAFYNEFQYWNVLLKKGLISKLTLHRQRAHFNSWGNISSFPGFTISQELLGFDDLTAPDSMIAEWLQLLHWSEVGRWVEIKQIPQAYAASKTASRCACSTTAYLCFFNVISKYTHSEQRLWRFNANTVFILRLEEFKDNNENEGRVKKKKWKHPLARFCGGC